MFNHVQDHFKRMKEIDIAREETDMEKNCVVSYSKGFGSGKVVLNFDGKKDYTYTTDSTAVGATHITEKELHDILYLIDEKGCVGIRRYMHSKGIFKRGFIKEA